jgi:hypothetical protein
VATGGALACPHCGKMTTSLKHYTMVKYLVFLYFFAFWGTQKHTACPICMRKELGLKTLVNLVPANLLWPFLVLPWNAVLFCMTFSDGHSAAIHNALRK